MRAHTPTGWNTWDYRGFNRFVYLSKGRAKCCVAYAIWDETVPPPAPDSRKLGELYENFRWTEARRIGPKAALGLPASLEFAAGEVNYCAEAIADGERMRLTVTPLKPSRQRVVFLLLEPAGKPVNATSPTAGRFADWKISLTGATFPQRYFLNLPVAYALGGEGEAASIEVAPAKAKAGELREGAFEELARTSFRSDGGLADAAQAMFQAVAWNTHYDTRRRLVSSPVCRDWCIDWRGPIVFGWDSFFAALMAATESPDLYRANIEAVLAGVDELGFVPNYFMAHGAASLDRSMPCLGAFAVWKTEQVAPDKAWLAGIYPRLRKWHRFWMRERQGKNKGLLAWGSNPEPKYEFPQLLPYNPSLQHTAKCAMYEAGLDNSPMYDDVPFNPETNTFELADVLLSSYYALDCEALANLAALLGREGEAKAYRREHAQMSERINATLWDEEHGIYCNRHWDGRYSSRWSPSSFFPMLAGVPSEAQARRLVEEHLLNEKEFWGTYPLPSISRSDPAFNDNDYWRGRIWGPFSYLLAEGLRRYRMDDVAAEFAKRSLHIFLRNWHEDGGVYENYNADTGKGSDVWNAARLYHWGGLLALLAVYELADSESGGYLRFGSLDFPESRVQGLHLGGARYDVELGDGLRVRRDGELIVESPGRVIVRIPLHAPEGTPLAIRAKGPGQVTIHDPHLARPTAQINGGQQVEASASNREFRYTWNSA